jgi:hypothetical protein
MADEGAGANDQDGAGLGFASGPWGQQQAEVAVSDPAGRQDLAERVGAELIHCLPPPSSRWTLAGSAYWLHEDKMPSQNSWCEMSYLAPVHLNTV